MRVFKTLLFLALLGCVLAVIALFTLQNMDQTIELGLNLGPVGAWRFSKPQPAVFVLLGAFGSGLVLVGLFAVYEVILFERKVRRLNRIISKLKGTPSSGEA